MLKIADSNSFRIWLPGKVVEIAVQQNGKTTGQLICYALPYGRGQITTSITDILFEKYNIEDTTVKKIVDHWQLIKNLPDDSGIKGWRPVLDGFTYVFENCAKDIYNIKTYETPDVQNIAEAKAIQLFIDMIHSFDDLKKFNSLFIYNLMPGDYTCDDNQILRRFTLKEIQKRKKRANLKRLFSFWM